MSEWGWIFLCLGWPIAALATFVAWRFYRSAKAYDDVFQYIAEDIGTNIMYLGKVSKMNVMMEDPSIQQVHRNMINMGRRLEEILKRMEETSGLHLRPLPPPPRPKIMD